MKFVASKTPVAGVHKKLGKFSIPVEVPQVESIDEFISFTGGPDKALSFVNRAIETASKNGVRAAARNLDEKLDPAVLAPGGEKYNDLQQTAKDYVPQSGQERGISAAKGKVIANQLATLVADPNKQSFTREELEALIAASK